MRIHMSRLLGTLGFAASVFVVLCLCPALTVSAQDSPEIYTATVIASEGLPGASGRMNIRIVSRTTDEEKAKLIEAFQKSPDEGMRLLNSMTKGFINIEGQSGRKISAVFSRERQDGYEMVVISEHMVSKLEKWNDVKPEDHPVAVIHLRFLLKEGTYNGEIYPAVKLAVTTDGFVDAKTDNANKVTMINIAKK